MALCGFKTGFINMFSNKRVLGIFFQLVNNLFSFAEILVRMEQLEFIKQIACLSAVNVCMLPLQIYIPDSHAFTDQIINFNPFLVKIYHFERNKDVLFKFISKEILKLFIFSLRTNLVCKIYNLVCKTLNRYIINLRRTEVYFICQKVISYKAFPCY